MIWSNHLLTFGKCRKPLRHNLLFVVSCVWCLASLSLVSCIIPDDIPYPIVETEITSFEVVGQCDEMGESTTAANIDRTNHVIDLYVNDQVDIKQIRVTKIEAANDPHVILNDTIRLQSPLYPTQGLPVADNQPLVIDFSQTQYFTMRTYQDYSWTVRVRQVVKR